MKAIILAAGKGERMRSINSEIPKVLIPILKKPMLVWNIELLKKHNINEIAINTHHKPEKIREYLGDGNRFGVNIRYSYEEELLGTAGALNNFKDFFDDTFIVLYGDVISLIDLSKLIHFHKENNADATLVVHETDHPEDSDIIRLDSESKIINLYHKPGGWDYGNLGSAALYVLEPEVLNHISEGVSDFIEHVFPNMIFKGKNILGYNTNEFIKDAGTPKRLDEIQQYLKDLDNR